MRGAWKAVDAAGAIAASRVRGRRWAYAACMAAALAALFSAGLCVAAVLARAPVAAVPLVAVVCAGCPVFASWELPTAVETLRATTTPTDARAIVSLRKSLDELPETDHPLGY